MDSDIWQRCSASWEKLEALTQKWKIRLNEYILYLNESKTEYMKCGLQTDDIICIDCQNLNKVNFKYLDSHISTNWDTLLDTQAGVNAAWLKWRQNTQVLCHR